MRYRDLGLTEATGGRMRAEHIRTHKPGGLGTGWHCHDLDFQLVYVLNGFVEFTAEGHGDIRLGAGGCAHIPPFTMHDETRFSDDFEVLEITLPAEVRTLTEKPVAGTGRPDSKFVASHLGPDSFAAGDGPRAFLEYRDLGVSEATHGRVQAQVVRTNGPCDESTGWHYHMLDLQFVYVLNGWVRTELEGYGTFLMERGDAMSVPARHKHDVTGFSADFEVLELNMPAEFETVAVDAPAPH
ncbi:MAG: cupin domain-containing protein [Alphaproteobacteria bacterium]|nr:cupin domain-containing protein [Alphaproteobacteria bacterium]